MPTIKSVPIKDLKLAKFNPASRLLDMKRGWPPRWGHVGCLSDFGHRENGSGGRSSADSGGAETGLVEPDGAGGQGCAGRNVPRGQQTVRPLSGNQTCKST